MKSAIQPLLQWIDVTIVQSRRRLLEQVCAQIQPAQFTSLIGENGSGKSTLIKTLYQRNAGTVLFAGKPIEHYSGKALAKRLAVLPQFSSLNFAFRAFDVVLLGRSIHDTRSPYNEYLAEKLMRDLDVWSLHDRRYPSLSGGEKQRIHLARVLAQLGAADEHADERTDTDLAKLLILDEPTSALDLAHQHSCLQYVRSLRTQNIAVLAVLHDLNLVSQYSEHIIAIKSGQIYRQGTPQTVLNQANIAGLYGYQARFIQHGEQLVIL